MIKKFKSLKEFNEYTNNRQWMKSGEQYWIEDQGQLYFLTNNIDGETKTYEMMDEIPEGYIVPTGNKEITENGEGIDVSEFATASVDVPIPEGYIIPSGNKEITANGTNIDVNDYATASVNVPIPEGYIKPSGNISITENGENIDIAQYATATVNVPSGTEDLIDFIEENDTETFNIPNGTTKIGDYAFYTKKYKNINIPDSVTEIGNHSFYGCPNLESIILPEGIKKLDGEVFRTSNLVNITLPSTITFIGQSVFKEIKKLNPVYIPYNGAVGSTYSDMLVDGDYFYSCFYVPEQYYDSYSSHYYKCKDAFLTYPRVNNNTEIVFNINVKSNGEKRLVNHTCCITKIIIDDVEQDLKEKHYLNSGEHIVKVGLYDSRYFPRKLLYYSSDYFTASVALPEGIEVIGANAFIYASLTGDLVLPSSLRIIGDGAFAYGNTALTSVTIPNSVTSIGNYVFNGCTGLTSISVKATTPPTLGTSVFNSTNNCPIYVPAESVDTYKAATNWSSYASRIQAIPTE